MPSARPRAAFEPISPDFDLKALVESTPNFEWVVRIHCDMIDHQGLENFEKLVLIHVILGGKPLVIEGYESRLDRWTFALQWLRDNCGTKVEHARDLTKKTNVPLSIAHYLNNMALLTNQWTPQNYKDPNRQRMYLKDIDCPQLWHDKLSEIIPPALFYLNESTGDIGGFGAVEENDPIRPGMRKGRGIAKAGDLMSSLPKEMRAENLMCYIGHEGTYTPAHREMCASLGQNIMVEASTGKVEDGKPTKPGSSIWFMTESKEREVVSEYWLSRLGHDIELENHFAQINAWKNAPFKTYVVEQKPGDFILIPPLAPHQVWNRGTRTMKVAWNRTTVETLELALHEALPRARLVCRDEQYKNKAIVYYTMQKYSKLLKLAEKFRQRAARSERKPQSDTKVRQLEKDFRRLHHLFTEILVSESFLPDRPEKDVEKLTYDSNITCSYCRCNIFNRFLTCPNCVETLPNGEEDTYDVCLECYAMGRSCACISHLRWVEQWSWSDLVQKHEQWRHQILQYEGKVTERSPVSLKTELNRLGKRRTLAQICQLELTRRPFHDIHNPQPPVQEEKRYETFVDAKGQTRKRVTRSEKFEREHARCHIDFHFEPKWKQATCTNCGKNYCYGTLFRAYDMMPQDILADPEWQCPSCRNICGCRPCRSRLGDAYKPYTPSSTFVGHNTKAVADPRSVESLVDFSYSNLGWIQKAGDDNGADTRRLNQRRKEAAAAKDSNLELGDDYVDGETERDDGIEDGILRLAEHEGIPIDPALGDMSLMTNGSAADEDDDDEFDENPEGAKIPEDLVMVNTLEPQFVVPAGGVLRDQAHAYDPTEAITYDYPDPESDRAIVPAVEEEAPLPSGYAPAVQGDAGEIEMVERKRKRTKVDEGDRPYGYKKAKPKKQQKSLIVKLPVNPEKLAEMEKMASIARQALNGVDAPAPVIGSDLQALNMAEGNPQGAPKRSRTVEEDVVDQDEDDDFTPGRYRDRRRLGADGAPRPPPDAEITRRQTRLQNVHYEEPSEEEFDEVVEPEQPAQKKQVEKQQVVRLVDVEMDTDDAEGESDFINETENNVSASSPPVEIGPDPALEITQAAPTASLTVTQKPAPTTRDSASEKGPKRPASPSSESPPPRKTQPAKPPQVTTSDPKSLSEAQANRKAKMAAIEWMENGSDDLDDAWSQDSFLDDDGAPARQSSSPPPAPKAAPASTSASKPVISVTIQKQHNGPQSTPDSTRVTPKVPLPVKVSADAWVDSDSDDEPPPRRAPAPAPHQSNGHGQSWAAVNGGSASVGRGAGRGRGKGMG
ncbi:hypothetical protein ABEF92_002385 [Exophiala dermatitidis]|uniref:JmjC domain-containing protein n=1 Tax=Exophiala dermatitidis (strain ATCC 34100 / CBS 525.76 / NIH/UT8656) TaxID=858893 RepID=H6BUE0_EXODN|nr:uncharacterized protein HMPREF1120_03807 [Exophiala dermatitidis NIH/UT8656]EHY55682.1 hypothetical protein HMPREF1120_03807 [Exophiala dermatitidis NIH/UT8656]